MQHVPVLLNEVVDFFKNSPHPVRNGLDLTFGRGGHSLELLRHFPELKLTGVDRDIAAVEFAKQNFTSEISQGRLQILHRNFHDPLPTTPNGWDLILADLGVSSPQLDQAERGFSFYNDGPLDMRMDQSQAVTAQDIVNTWNPDELIQLFKEYGEIRRPDRVVARIIEQRLESKFTTTKQLSQLIEKAEGWQRKGHHPATRYFLALRLEVNAELSALGPALVQMRESLSPGGRLAVITFHSLEDRIVKYDFREGRGGSPVNKKVVVPGREEQRTNPRARSAKLRVWQRDEQP